MKRKILIFTSLLLMVCAISVVAQRIKKHGGLVDVNSSGDILITPASGRTVIVTGALSATGGVTQTSGLFTGQLSTTRDPANGTNTSASLLVNPATSAANEFLFVAADNGTTRFSADKEGDVVAGASLKVGSGTVLTRLAYYTATLSPIEVGANTCAEELFTVTGITAGDVVFVNKPTAQAGLGVAGVRASGSNQVGINFCNATAAPITPTASQAYVFGVMR